MVVDLAGDWGTMVPFADLRIGDCFEDLSGLCALTSVSRDTEQAMSVYTFTRITEFGWGPRIGVGDEHMAESRIRIVLRHDASDDEREAAVDKARERMQARRKKSNRMIRREARRWMG